MKPVQIWLTTDGEPDQELVIELHALLLRLGYSTDEPSWDPDENNRLYQTSYYRPEDS